MAGDLSLRKYTWGRDLSGLPSAGSSPPGVAGTDGASALTAAAGGFSAQTAACSFSAPTVAGAFSPVAGVAFAPVAADEDENLSMTGSGDRLVSHQCVGGGQYRNRGIRDGGGRKIPKLVRCYSDARPHVHREPRRRESSFY